MNSAFTTDANRSHPKISAVNTDHGIEISRGHRLYKEVVEMMPTAIRSHLKRLISCMVRKDLEHQKESGGY